MPVLDDVLSAALYYAGQGFHVFPVHGITPFNVCTCGNPDCIKPDHRGKISAGKHPWTPRGLLNASNDSEVVSNLFANKSHANVGIVTGPISNIFVLDVDGVEGETSLSNYPALPATLTSTTGKGRHIVFRYPTRKVFTRAGRFAAGLDVRGEGGYIVAAPSVHATGVVYTWVDESPIAEAPQWLLDIVCRPPAERTYTAPASHSDKPTTDEIREILSYVDPDCGYDDWIQVGMALHNEGYSLSVWDEWSGRGLKYRPGCTIPHWKSFHSNGGVTIGSLIHAATLSGWKPKEAAPMSLDDHPAREFIMRVRNGEFSVKSVAANPQPITAQLFDPLKIPGIVGDTVRNITATAQKPQPELALLNTLAALGAVFGRRYASPMDTRTNLYTVGIAVTAAGKDHSRRFIKKLMIEANMETFIGADTFVSGSGLLTAVNKKPAQIMHLDEFGMLLEAITDQRGAAHMKAASKVITEMYSSSSMTYLGGQYADAKTEPVRIAAPNLCIYGTTTPEKYVNSLNKSVITSGELNRFLVLKPSVDRPTRVRFMGAAKPDSQLIADWQSLLPATPILNNSSIVPEPIPVNWPELEDRVWDMGLYEDAQIAKSDVGALWGRYRENVIKIAMILAIARNPLVPLINDTDFDIAEAIVRQAVEYTVSLATDHMADSQHEKDCNDILTAIRKRGGKLTQSALCVATRRMNGKQRDDAIKSLLDQDLISIDKDANSPLAGRKATFIRIL